MRFDLSTLDSGERSLPIGLLVSFQWWLCFSKRKFMDKSLSAPGQWTTTQKFKKIAKRTDFWCIWWQDLDIIPNNSTKCCLIPHCDADSYEEGKREMWKNCSQRTRVIRAIFWPQIIFSMTCIYIIRAVHHSYQICAQTSNAVFAVAIMMAAN